MSIKPIDLKSSRHAFRTARHILDIAGLQMGDIDLAQVLMEKAPGTDKPAIEPRITIYTEDDYVEHPELLPYFMLDMLTELDITPEINPLGGFTPGKETEEFLRALEGSNQPLTRQEIMKTDNPNLENIEFLKDTSIPGVKMWVRLNSKSPRVPGFPSITELGFEISPQAYAESLRYETVQTS